MGVLKLGDRLFDQQAGSIAPFLRALPIEEPISDAVPSRQPPEVRQRPTHVLYRHLAYPITDQPLTIGLEPVADASGIQIRGQTAGVSRKHCTIRLHGNDIVLADHSTYGTFVNEKPVDSKTRLSLGQIIRVGTPGEILKLIACVNTDET
jgi:hypothetical protein